LVSGSQIRQGASVQQTLRDLGAQLAEGQPSASVKTLPDHPGRTTAIRGFSAVAYGLPSIVAGLFAGWSSWNWHLTGSADTIGNIKFSFLLLLTGTFFLGGSYFSVHGVQDILALARKRRFSVEQPGKPWLGDYPWRPEGFKFSALRETTKPLTAALIGSALVAPFIWVALGNPFAWAFDLFVGILALLPGLTWWRWFAMLRRASRFGSSFLTYDTFPFFVGNTLRARLQVRRNLESIQSLTLTLRCVQEKYVTTGGSKRWGVSRGTTSTVSYELFSEVLVLDRSKIMNLQSGGIPLQFSIPANAPPSRLSDRPPVYWEIEARGETQGTAYQALLLVPVYSASQ
jgi:hypothetical protein